MSSLNIQDLPYLAELDDQKVSVSGASGYSYGGYYDIKIAYSLDYDFKYYGKHYGKYYSKYYSRRYDKHSKKYYY